MIEIKNVQFSYAKNPRLPSAAKALSGASGQIGEGIHLMLGPNGAGKTTLQKIICGMLQPLEGECLIDGNNISRRNPTDLANVFYLSEDCLFPLDTINEMSSRHAPFYPNFSAEMLHANLEAFGLGGNEKFINMSLGNRKKANVSYALALRPKVILLDEPANGMDISSKKILNQIIASCVDESQTLIVATHTVHQMRNLFDGVVYMHKGQIALCKSVDQITSDYAFVVNSSPIPGALYSESDITGHHCMLMNDEGIETQIDYELLYGAIANGVVLPKI